MAIRPIGNRVLLKLKKAETKTAGGIYIPEDAENSKKQAQVVALGDGKDIQGIKVGDEVMYDSYGGTEITDKEDKFLIVDFKDIVAILE